ncbi:MAG TPA: FlgD immunoglobulin-like domain containing protein [Vicinamibacterales bacterium]
MIGALAGRLAIGLFACALVATAAASQGVTVALTPAGQQVAPGATFTLEVTVTSAGSPFNGFDAVIEYDPAALTLLPASPTSLQQGTLMTSACANTFHRFRHGVARDTISCVLLCNGVSVAGPGQIYRLQFRASTASQVSAVRFLPGLQFYDAGLYVNPAHATDALVGIGMPVPLAVGPPPAANSPRLKIAPNPAHGGTVFTLEADRAGPQRVAVFDVRGRRVRIFEDSVGLAGTRTLAWDGLDEAGNRVAPGIYLVTLQVAGHSVSSRITMIR